MTSFVTFFEIGTLSSWNSDKINFIAVFLSIISCELKSESKLFIKCDPNTVSFVTLFFESVSCTNKVVLLLPCLF